MSRTNFIFIALFYLLFAIFSWVEHVDIIVQLAVSGLFLFLVGIPHGAIDHVLFLDSKKMNPVYFYGAYLGLMAVYVVLWFIFPLLSFLFFMLMSAYHFGQSQFSEISEIPNPVKQVMYMSWGISILTGLLLYNLDELSGLFAGSSDLAFFTTYFKRDIFEIITLSSTAITLFIYGVCGTNSWMKSERIATELYLLLLIHAAFFVLPLIIGFTLYFTVLHSFKVLTQEYSFLEKRKGKLSPVQFAGMLAPYTILSVFGLGLLLFLQFYGILNVSGLLIALVLISAVTLPHSVVMENFYKKS